MLQPTGHATHAEGATRQARVSRLLSVVVSGLGDSYGTVLETR